jgi:homoserine O-succinyltransferase
MPVFLQRHQPGQDSKPCSQGSSEGPAQGSSEGPGADSAKQSGRPLRIGLINNMPDAALEATERQFISLLNAVSEDVQVRLSIYALPGVPRNESGAAYVRKFYASTDELRHTRLDGLIVTGREPLARNLAEEPYWHGFTQILEWAKDHTRSTIWSCLAAHAAVLYMDGIDRIKSGDKHFGIFDCELVLGHALTKSTPQHFRLPHSRWNGLPESALTKHGYSILTRTESGNVDSFIRQQKSLFIFFQGHPEYESNTLLLEYRRDVGRYIRGESGTYPRLPKNYFGTDTEFALSALHSGATSRPGAQLLAELSTILENAPIENTWRSTAACLYRNWLEHLCTERELERLDTGLAVEVTEGKLPHGISPLYIPDGKSYPMALRSAPLAEEREALRRASLPALNG